MPAPRKKKSSAKFVTPIVRFSIRIPGAREVCVAGSFNEWHPTVAPMIDLGEGLWVKDVTLAPGRHEYLFVADGCWQPDPQAAESTPNPHGGLNSVVVVK